MTELYAIQGRWNPEGYMKFNEKDKWTGYILLEDDGWFEGIVINKETPYQDDFVFGFFKPEKGIELIKVSSSNSAQPLTFHGKKTDDGYDGSFETQGQSKRTFLGSSRITAAEEFDNDFVCTAKYIEKKIDMFKTDATANKYYYIKAYEDMREKRRIAEEMLSRYFNGGSYDNYIKAMKSDTPIDMPYVALPFEEELMGVMSDIAEPKTYELFFGEKKEDQ